MLLPGPEPVGRRARIRCSPTGSGVAPAPVPKGCWQDPRNGALSSRPGGARRSPRTRRQERRRPVEHVSMPWTAPRNLSYGRREDRIQLEPSPRADPSFRADRYARVPVRAPGTAGYITKSYIEPSGVDAQDQGDFHVGVRSNAEREGGRKRSRGGRTDSEARCPTMDARDHPVRPDDRGRGCRVRQSWGYRSQLRSRLRYTSPGPGRAM